MTTKIYDGHNINITEFCAGKELGKKVQVSLPGDYVVVDILTAVEMSLRILERYSVKPAMKFEGKKS